MKLLERRRVRPNWINETDTMEHIKELGGLWVELIGGSRGWASFRVGDLQLTNIVVEVISGHQATVAAAILRSMVEQLPSASELRSASQSWALHFSGW